MCADNVVARPKQFLLVNRPYFNVGLYLAWVCSPLAVLTLSGAEMARRMGDNVLADRAMAIVGGSCVLAGVVALVLRTRQNEWYFDEDRWVDVHPWWGRQPAIRWDDIVSVEVESYFVYRQGRYVYLVIRYRAGSGDIFRRINVGFVGRKALRELCEQLVNRVPGALADPRIREWSTSGGGRNPFSMVTPLVAGLLVASIAFAWHLHANYHPVLLSR